VYAKPGDTRWVLMSDSLLYGRFQYTSVSTLQGHVYLATYEGNILQVRIRPDPRLVPMVMDQPFNESVGGNVISYLVSADDHQRHRGMQVVHYYSSLGHLNIAERRKMKCMKKREVIRVESDCRARRWHLIQVLKVDLAGERLVPVEDIGRHRALFVGELACLSLSTERFPSVAGNAVYFGLDDHYSGKIGVRYLGDKTADPPFKFLWEDGSDVTCALSRRLQPIACPCTLQEYLVCLAGIKGGLKD
jgi:hypothetical protein